jgi:ABC-type amino acid transport substrate-binding protein
MIFTRRPGLKAIKKTVPVFWAALFLFVFSIDANASEVLVGGYSFSPFVENVNGKFEGITLEMIKEMNALQDTYVFKFVLTSSKRRYRDFDHGDFDLIMFESIQWGWAGKPIEKSDVIYLGGEVYITGAVPGRGQDYFNDLKDKRILGYVGYHYGFADFNSDEAFLEKQFNVQFTQTHEGNIRSVAAGRADIAVVAISFLKKYLHLHPEIAEKILISQKLDQEYNLTMLMRSDTRPTIDEINGLILKMKENGALKQIFETYGIK